MRAHRKTIAWLLLTAFLNLTLVTGAYGMVMAPSPEPVASMAAMEHTTAPGMSQDHCVEADVVVEEPTMEHRCETGCEDDCSVCLHGAQALPDQHAEAAVLTPRAFISVAASGRHDRVPDTALRPPQTLPH